MPPGPSLPLGGSAAGPAGPPLPLGGSAVGPAGPLLVVARVVKPHGLRGEVIVELITNRAERLVPGTELSSSSGPLVILRSSRHHHRWIVAFEGVADRDEAERLRGLVLQAEPFEDPEVLWVHELVGSEMVGVDGRRLGRVVEVEANPASDLLVLEEGGLVPLRFVVSQGPGQVVVDPPAGLLD